MATGMRFCSHCQKKRDAALFYGINRNRGLHNDKIELLRTCEECRRKKALRRTLGPSAFRAVRTEPIRRNPRRQTFPSEARSAVEAVQRLDQRKRDLSTSTASVSTSASSVIEVVPAPIASSPPTKRRRTIGISSRKVKPTPRHISETPSPPPPSAHRSSTYRVVSSTSASALLGKQVGEVELSREEIMASLKPAPSGNGRELIQFAQSLERLAGLIATSVMHLGDEELGRLEGEIRHDWMIEEMSNFVEGFFKGAKKRDLW